MVIGSTHMVRPGYRRTFRARNLEDADLIDARLPDALLNKTILKRADLMLADFSRGRKFAPGEPEGCKTCWARSSIRQIFRPPRLMARQGFSVGNSPEQTCLAPHFPVDTSPSEALKYVRQVASKAGWYLIAILAG